MHAAAGRHARPRAVGNGGWRGIGTGIVGVGVGVSTARNDAPRRRCPRAAASNDDDSSDALVIEDEDLASVLEDPPFIMVNSCTGRMGHAAAEAIVRAGLPLVPYTLTGYSAGVAVGGVGVAGIPVEVVGKASRQEALDRVKEQYGGGAAGGQGGGATNPAGRLVVVDYTTPAAALDNARFYARNGVPFVMGTTGADAELVTLAAEEAGVPALVAPQMGKQVVALQAALRMASEAFPGAFGGYELDVVESHQASKVDVSGTAREVVRSLRALGGRFAAEEEEEEGAAAEAGTSGGGGGSSSSSDPAWHVRRVRDRATQQSPAIGVPYDALGGHAYHTYTLSSPGAPPLPPLLAASSGSGGVSSSSSSGEQRRRKAAAAAAAAAAAGETPAAAAAAAAAAPNDDPDAGSWSRFVFKHNVVGREVYARGTADAVLFLAAAARAAARRGASGGGGGSGSGSGSGSGGGSRRHVFDMVDVLRAGDLRARAARARAARKDEDGDGAPRQQKQQPPVSSSSSSAARRANSPSVAAAAAASAAATRTAKEERAKAIKGEADA